MKIQESETITGKSYTIFINPEANLDPFEIAECFKHQYPKEKAVISFLKIQSVKIGLILVGFRLNKKKQS
ncbi:MAG: hypothetical protein ACTSYG_10895 [Candidatus Heimdallarchaeota archaeon]